VSKPPPNVCEEPEPVRRVWAQIRQEIGINLLHYDRQRIYDVIAHELAEQQRKHFIPRPPGKTADYVRGLDDGLDAAADLIDPEVKR
jgi:hypothetical protein